MVKFIKVVGVKGDDFNNMVGGVDVKGKEVVEGCKVVMVVNGYKVFDKNGEYVVEGCYEGVGIKLDGGVLEKMIEGGDVIEFGKYIGLMIDEDGFIELEIVNLNEYYWVNKIFENGWGDGDWNKVLDEVGVKDLDEVLVDYIECENENECDGLVEEFKEKVKGKKGVMVEWGVEYDKNVGLLIK